MQLLKTIGVESMNQTYISVRDELVSEKTRVRNSEYVFHLLVTKTSVRV